MNFEREQTLNRTLDTIKTRLQYGDFRFQDLETIDSDLGSRVWNEEVEWDFSARTRPVALHMVYTMAEWSGVYGGRRPVPVEEVHCAMKYLIKRMPQPNPPYWSNGATALHKSAQFNTKAVTETLLADADPNTLDNYHKTPLHWCTQFNPSPNSDRHVDMVQLLLARGCDVTLQDDLGKTALQSARDSGIQDRVVAILQEALDKKRTGEDGNSRPPPAVVEPTSPAPDSHHRLPSPESCSGPAMETLATADRLLNDAVVYALGDEISNFLDANEKWEFARLVVTRYDKRLVNNYAEVLRTFMSNSADPQLSRTAGVENCTGVLQWMLRAYGKATILDVFTLLVEASSRQEHVFRKMLSDAEFID